MEPIYMDYNATTPLHAEVEKSLINSLNTFGNASSMHQFGLEAEHKIEDAREKVASLIQASPEEIIFTSGGSESNNAVLKMLLSPDSADIFPPSKQKIITTSIEHPCILESSSFLEKNGVEVHYLSVDNDGRIDLNQLEELLCEKTALVSIMTANNEIGTIQDIPIIADIVHKAGALLHTDAVQAVGKIPVNVNNYGVDYLTLSAHKIYGPKGVGALYVKKNAPFSTFIHGGHQEDGLRAGTYNSPGIIGFGKAAEIAEKDITQESERLLKLRTRLKEGIISAIPDTYINGHDTEVLPNTLNVSFRGAEGESLLLYLDMEGIAVSTGSACASGSLEPSHVLLSIGRGPELAHGSLRFSLGRLNTEADIDYVLDKLPGIVERTRNMSTIYHK